MSFEVNKTYAYEIFNLEFSIEILLNKCDGLQSINQIGAEFITLSPIPSINTIQPQ